MSFKLEIAGEIESIIGFSFNEEENRSEVTRDNLFLHSTVMTPSQTIVFKKAHKSLKFPAENSLKGARVTNASYLTTSTHNIAVT